MTDAGKIETHLKAVFGLLNVTWDEKLRFYTIHAEGRILHLSYGTHAANVTDSNGRRPKVRDLDPAAPEKTMADLVADWLIEHD